VTIAAVGDTMVGSVYPSRAAMPPEDGRRIFERVKDLWTGADVVMGNFEGTVSSTPSAARALGSHSYRFLMPVESLSIYKDAGFNVLNVANNHGMDAGAPGRAATLRELEAAGIAQMGSLDRPTTVITAANGIKIGLIGTAPHMDCFPMDVAQVAAKIRELKQDQGCSIVVVSMHAGAEGERALHVTKRPERYLGADRGNVYAFAHGVIDAGADLVVGHGPHVPRGMQIYKHRLIAYSLGNFATYGMFSVKGPGGLGLVLTAVLGEDGTLQSFKLLSTHQDRGGEGWSLGIPVEPDPDEGARKLVEALSLKDFRIDISGSYENGAEPELLRPLPPDKPAKARPSRGKGHRRKHR